MSDLLYAAAAGDLATIKRLHAEGADMSERGMNGVTAIIMAAVDGNVKTVKCLQAAGASITERTDGGFSPMHYAALNGRLSLVQYFLQEAKVSIREANNVGATVWTLLKIPYGFPRKLASLLKIMVMLDDAPPAFVAQLSPAHAELTTRGRFFRVQLLTFLEQQRASVFEHCPLPAVLLPIVAEYAVTTPEDMWTDGLRVQADRPKRPRLLAGAEEDEEVPLRRSRRQHM
jgi:hypothetical protein